MARILRLPEDKKLRDKELGSMTPEERVALAVDMSSVVIRIAVDSIRDQHPRWSEKQSKKQDEESTTIDPVTVKSDCSISKEAVLLLTSSNAPS